MPAITVSSDTWLEMSNIEDGTLKPLSGFLDAADYRSVVDKLCLSDGTVWPLPITLDVPMGDRRQVEASDRLVLLNESGEEIGEVCVADIYEVPLAADALKIFGTTDTAHPGLAKELSRSALRAGGTLQLLKPPPLLFPEHDLTPAATTKIFEARGWCTVAGFQTRNPPHRAHEYLQRVALEVTDGLFIQPLIGWKKSDDFSPQAIIEAYEQFIGAYYPADRVVLGTLRTPMRYAGPREALFHALIRRNHGCSHFIVGRDHAGVGAFYGTYEAQSFALAHAPDDIEILPLCGPFHCEDCRGIVTERTCRHGEEKAQRISGTRMRSLLSEGVRPPETFMRTEVAEVLIQFARQGKLFVGVEIGL